MVDRRPKLLFDALAAIDAATSFVAGHEADHYADDLLIRSAVERQLEILGEACSRLAREEPELPTTIPAVRLAIGTRNRIIHGYDAVDDRLVYRTVVDDLPTLRVALAAMLARLE